MAILEIKPKESCRYDLISLGEVMLRLDPGEGRIHTARQFRVWEGGGEYNVARGLRRCFGMRTAIVTALADNAVGRLIEDCILQGGVDTSFLRWVAHDGVGRSVRNGLNFTERGFGIRGALGVSDRGHTAASQMKKGDIGWEDLFDRVGVRWFHTGGIFAALSESTPEVIEEAMKAARKYGTVVSYDLNYRPSLWKSIGGKNRAREVNRRLAPYVDVMLGNEEDFTACLGFEVEGLDVRPAIGLLHFAPFYKDLALACGFRKCIDWHCFLVRKIDDLVKQCDRVGPVDETTARTKELLESARVALRLAPPDLAAAERKWVDAVRAVSPKVWAAMFPEAMTDKDVEARMICHGIGATKEECDKRLNLIESMGCNGVLESLGSWMTVIYHSDVVPVEPGDPGSLKEGRGRFHAELWVMSWFGVDFTRWTKPQLVAARFYFDAIFPFLALVLFSWFTRPEPRAALDRFFAKVHTPVQPTREAEYAALEAAYANPRQFDSDKVFTGENWEILKPSRSDYVGFFGTWALVGVVILLLWAMVTVR